MESPAAFDTTFTHEPLPDPAKYIRLLEVLDDKYSKSIKVRCTLTTWPIDSAPLYHAISYTWGDPKSNTFILMNDKTLQVRTNCEFALKQAYWYRRSQSYWYRKWRSRWYEESRPEWYSKSRYFWLDAICIDQTNLEEKSKQVAMMGSIYKKASHVLACIGDHADDSLFFFRTLYGLNRYVVGKREMFRPDEDKAFHGKNGNNGVSRRFRMLHRLSTTHRFILALARLAVRPYFTRMWILQELQYAQHITILCGQYVLLKEDAICLFDGLFHGLSPYDSMMGVRSALIKPPHGEFVNRRLLRRLVNHGLPSPIWHGDWIHGVPRQCMTTLNMLRQNYPTVKDNMFPLLKDVVRQLQSADARDKVYGIISLIEWGDAPPLEPDYTHSDLEVAVKFLETLMQLQKTRDIGKSIWKYMILVTKIFNLDTGSRGLIEAFEARRGPPKSCAVDAARMPFGGSTVGLQAPGWRLLPEDIDKNMSILEDMQASPPKFPPHRTFLLPRWARADDWVIQGGSGEVRELWYNRGDLGYSSQPIYTPLLIMREGSEGSRCSLIGYGFYGSMDRHYYPDFKHEPRTDVKVYLDIEDGIIFLWRMKQLFELVFKRHSEPRDWILEYLDIGVCKQQTPWSSYAMLPPNLPAREERIDPWSDGVAFSLLPVNNQLSPLKDRLFVLWDTMDRRGWLVDGPVAALQLLLTYLKNVPQTETFDFSRLNHIDNKTPSAAWEILKDDANMNIFISRVFKGDEEKPEDDEASKDLVVEISLREVVHNICNLLVDMFPSSKFPAEYHKIRWGEFHKADQKRGDIIMKGWDFERIYNSNKEKVFVYKFDKEPVWFRFSKDLQASFLFGRNLGEVIQPHDKHRCPYFKTLPKGQDYLAAGLHTLQKIVTQGADVREKDESVARLTYHYAWERCVDPFSHEHGQGDHLDRVDSSCFPVQRPVKTPNSSNDKRELDIKLLRKGKGRLYSSQDVDDMKVVFDGDMNKESYKSIWKGPETWPKPGIIVFGNKPDAKKLRKLAQANLQQNQPSGGPQILDTALVATQPSNSPGSQYSAQSSASSAEARSADTQAGMISRAQPSLAAVE